MKKLGTYNCEGAKKDWKDGYYQIDFENANQRKFAIWYNGQWAVANITSMKKAINILKEEFISVKQLQD
jgi:hypothetical protein